MEHTIEVTEKILGSAFFYGYASHVNDKVRAPVVDRSYMLLITDMEVGQAVDVSKAWLAGWDEALHDDNTGEW